MSRPTRAKSQKPKSQSNSFEAAAKEMGLDLSEAEFDRALGQIGRANVPKDDVKPADRRKRATRKPIKLAL